MQIHEISNRSPLSKGLDVVASTNETLDKAISQITSKKTHSPESMRKSIGIMYEVISALALAESAHLTTEQNAIIVAKMNVISKLVDDLDVAA